MNASSVVRAGHRIGLLALVVTAVLALSGCSAFGVGKSSAANEHACSDKLVKEMVTNASVDGLWNCLSADLQNTLHMYGVEGDDVFTSPNQAAPNVVSQKYVGRSNGVDVYVVVIKPENSGTLFTFVIAAWTDSQNKITNFDVTNGAF